MKVIEKAVLTSYMMKACLIIVIIQRNVNNRYDTMTVIVVFIEVCDS